MSTAHFYQDLPPDKRPLSAILHGASFFALPSDWFVVVADIKGSTLAVAEGRHNDVNLVAAGSLIAALNIARRNAIDIPFFFGGDGGTLLVPGEILPAVLAALHQHNLASAKNFRLSLHTGALSMAHIRSAGHDILVAKTVLGAGFAKAMAIGNGIQWAERQIKSAQNDDTALPDNPLDMMGLECRWDRIKPPADTAEIVCYLIEACHAESQPQVYGSVLGKADDIYGTTEIRNPLSSDRLRLRATYEKLKREMKARLGRWKTGYFIREIVKTAIATVLFRRNWKVGEIKGRAYLDEVAANADTLTIDGRINTIMSGTVAQRLAFTAWLDSQEKAGLLLYGHHTDRESIMTCYIKHRDKEHIHFVDGSDGGYTAASAQLKRKMLKE